jgi:hypothetical protein
MKIQINCQSDQKFLMSAFLFFKGKAKLVRPVHPCQTPDRLAGNH